MTVLVFGRVRFNDKNNIDNIQYTKEHNANRERKETIQSNVQLYVLAAHSAIIQYITFIWAS